ncbi:MAG: sulfatase-like hydrolase/transferase [Clostridiales bacterium]|nr:sulfatase-like hydrolase/transferase [Clostridiales bacterium]
MGKHPHIIIFNPDQMRADSMGHLGNPAAKTPFLDRFAETEAVSFRNAFCQNPLCVPSRCSFFTGLYPHVNGHRTISYLLRPGETTMLKELKEAGYYVWMNDRNDLLAGQIPGWAESHVSEIYCCGQKEIGPGPVRDIRGTPNNKFYYSHMEGQLGTDSTGKRYSPDDEAVDAAIARIQNRPADQPLCLFLGLMYPHPPYQIEEPYYSSIDRNLLPRRTRPEECSGKSRMIREIRENSRLEGLSESDWDEIRGVYLAMVSKVDGQFRRLVEVLKQEGIYDNCAIFFLSDHGDFTGDYGIPEKAQNCFEDCLTRVPLLIKPPAGYGLDPGISDSLTELVDFYATAMDIAGVQPTHSHFGNSLVPVLADRTRENRKYVCCEGGRLPNETHCDEYHLGGGKTASAASAYWPKMKAQSDGEAHSKATMLRTNRYKYIYRTLGESEFYDLETDPRETQNRIHDPTFAGIVSDMEKQMLHWLVTTADVVPFEHDARFTPDMMFARARCIAPKGYDALIQKKIDEGMEFIDLVNFCRGLSAGADAGGRQQR